MSRYKSSVIFCNSAKFRENIESFDILKKSKSLMFSDRNSFMSESKDIQKNLYNKNLTYLYIKSDERSCRESLIDDIHDILVKTKTPVGLTGSVSLVEYLGEDGKPLTKSHLEKIKKFSQIFLKSRFCQFKLTVRENFVVLACEHNEEFILTELWTISLFLYLFRNENILDEIVKRYRSTSRLSALYTYLIEEFLRNPGWGDSSNPAMALSLFCYTVRDSKGFLESIRFKQGPVNAVKNLSELGTLLDYIKDEILPILDEIQINKLIGQFNDETFTTIFNLFVKAGEYDKMMKEKTKLRKTTK